MHLYVSFYSLSNGDDGVIPVAAEGHTDAESEKSAWRNVRSRLGTYLSEDLTDDETFRTWNDSSNYVSWPVKVENVADGARIFSVRLQEE